MQQPVFASTQDHQVLEGALRTQISIPNVNCCCAGQARLVSVRHILAQERHLDHVLTIGMAVEAIRVHHSHDPCPDQRPGILAQTPGPGALVPSHALWRHDNRAS